MPKSNFTSIEEKRGGFQNFEGKQNKRGEIISHSPAQRDCIEFLPNLKGLGFG
jgi:hypothetical protein